MRIEQKTNKSKVDEAFPDEIEPRRFRTTGLDRAPYIDPLALSFRAIEAREIGQETLVRETVRKVFISNF